MLDFIDMGSMARYLFVPNTLPLSNLLMKSNMKALEALFSFQSLQVGADLAQFQLVAGAGEMNGVPIQQLVIEPVAITLCVVGDKHNLNQVYEVLCQFLAGIDPKKRMESPKLYTTAYQTQSTVRLPMPFEKMVAPKLLNFLESQKDILRPDSSSTANLQLSNLSFQVKYKQDNEVFSYLPKLLTIEPRAGADPKEHMYYVLTPTDSDAHRILVEGLGKAMAEAT